MIKAYLPFGDWSEDGHKQYKEILVGIDSTENLIKAQQHIKSKYGENFFKNFAGNYQEPCLSKENWQALIDTHMPIQLLQMHDECNDWEGCKSLNEALEIDNNPCLDLEFIIIAFVWIMNQYGAGIIQLSSEEDIIQINNWTCPGFETVGYGCFE